MADISQLQMDSGLFALRQTGQERVAENIDRKRTGENRSDEKLDDACRQFESLLLHMMIREMRKTVPDSVLFPPSMAQKVFTGMMDEKIAGEMAQTGGIGISRMLFDQLRENP